MYIYIYISVFFFLSRYIYKQILFFYNVSQQQFFDDNGDEYAIYLLHLVLSVLRFVLR